MIFSIVQTKGGVCKTTLAQCLAYSKAFKRAYGTVGLVELDPQGTLADIYAERGDRAKSDHVTFAQVLSKKPADKVKALMRENGALILDVPGESRSGFATKFAVAASDVVIIPTRSSTHDESSLAVNLWPFLAEYQREDLRVIVLSVLVHAQSNPKTHYDYFRSILPPTLDVCRTPFPSRPGVYENFNRGGATLAEYAQEVKTNQRYYGQAQKALADVEAIAKELVSYATA